MIALALTLAASCAPRADVVDRLSDRYGESAVSGGLLGDGSGVLEVWANRETGTWTTLLTLPDGTSCFVSSGDAWGPIPEVEKGERL